MKPWLINKILGFVPEIGNRIHLKTMEGHYEILQMIENQVVITCKVWQARNNYPKDIITKTISIYDIKCLAKV